jgi:hypothetical protein
MSRQAHPARWVQHDGRRHAADGHVVKQDVSGSEAGSFCGAYAYWSAGPSGP